MGTSEARHWPFSVLPEEERTDQHRREIEYLEAAYSRGFKPFTFGAGNYGATNNGRSGDILVRGRNRWEVALSSGDVRVASAFVDDFASAATAVLSWLEGGDTPTVLANVEGHLAVTPGSDRLFVVYAHSSG